MENIGTGFFILSFFRSPGKISFDRTFFWEFFPFKFHSKILKTCLQWESESRASPVRRLCFNLMAEIVETTLVISRFRFLRVVSRISVLRVIILPGMQILKFGSQISDWSWFRFSFLTFYVAASCINIDNTSYLPNLGHFGDLG